MKIFILIITLATAHSFATDKEKKSTIPVKEEKKAAIPTLKEQRENLVQEIKKIHKYPALETFEKMLHSSSIMGQGNPAVTKHPVSKEQCLKKYPLDSFDNTEHQKICGDRFMAPMPQGKDKKVSVCIDKFEFPNIPCEYPLVWVKTSEAVDICESLGKRLCDAHEWEGACSGELLEPDYDFQKETKDLSATVRKMRASHNAKWGSKKDWSYGPKEQRGICAMDSTKDKDCNGGDFKRCGSNTYPAGYFPQCKSKLDVYDIHGNAAEHMNLPLSPAEMGGKKGVTEMKGSWFIFDKFKAHDDWCRWRAPFWHGTRTYAKDSHHNYHLGFRCCKDIKSK
jgi:hypothetical protein